MSAIDRKLALLRAAEQRFSQLTTGLSAEQLRATSYADDWSIAQVASHLGSAAEIFATLIDAGRRGAPPPGPEAWQQIWDRWNARSPKDQIAQSVLAREALIADVESLDPATRDRFAVAAFGGTVDLATLIGMRLNEIIVHTWDVAVALDPAAVLAPDGVAEMIDETPALAAWMPPVPGLAPVLVETTAPQRRFRIAFEPTRSIESLDHDSTSSATPERSDPPLRMPAEAFLRLLYGRLDAAHAGGVADDPRLPRLREAFPGF